MDIGELGVSVRGQRYSLGECLIGGGTALLAIVAALGAVGWLPWFTLSALGVEIRAEGAGFLGWFALCCALATVWATLALRNLGDRLPKLPFKRTVVPLALGSIAALCLVLRHTLGVGIATTPPAVWSRGLGVQIALFAGMVVAAGAVLEFVRDPDPFITD